MEISSDEDDETMENYTVSTLNDLRNEFLNVRIHYFNDICHLFMTQSKLEDK